jgi:hypothetical protein
VFLLDLEKKLSAIKEVFSKKQVVIREVNLKNPNHSSTASTDSKGPFYYSIGSWYLKVTTTKFSDLRFQYVGLASMEKVVRYNDSN